MNLKIFSDFWLFLKKDLYKLAFISQNKASLFYYTNADNIDCQICSNIYGKYPANKIIILTYKCGARAFIPVCDECHPTNKKTRDYLEKNYEMPTNIELVSLKK